MSLVDRVKKLERAARARRRPPSVTFRWDPLSPEEAADLKRRGIRVIVLEWSGLLPPHPDPNPVILGAPPTLPAVREPLVRDPLPQPTLSAPSPQSALPAPPRALPPPKASPVPREPDEILPPVRAAAKREQEKEEAWLMANGWRAISDISDVFR